MVGLGSAAQLDAISSLLRLDCHELVTFCASRLNDRPIPTTRGSSWSKLRLLACWRAFGQNDLPVRFAVLVLVGLRARAQTHQRPFLSRVTMTRRFPRSTRRDGSFCALIKRAAKGGGFALMRYMPRW